MPKAITTVLFLFLFIILSAPALAYYDIDVIADAHIDEYNPSSNFGSGIAGTVGSLTGNNWRILYAFNISEIPFGETIISAELRIKEATYYNATTMYLSVFNTSYFNEYNVTWNNQPAEGTLQTNISVNYTIGEWHNFSVLQATQHARLNNQTLYLLIRSDENTSVRYSRTYWNREAGAGIEPYLYVQTAEGSGCNAPAEYVEGSACFDRDTYYTNDGCNYTLTDCPTDSYCVQLTPQMNVTSDLYENYTSCQIVTTLGLRVNCYNLCFWGTVVSSSCVEEQCKVCPDEQGGFSIGSTYGFYTDTYYTNQSSVSVPSWTVACGYSNGTIAQVINETGDNTTVTEILTRAGNNITEVAPAGTDSPPASADAGTAGLNDWLDAGMGSSYGSDIISLIVAAACAILLFINLKDSDKGTTIFFGTFMLVASICSFIGILTPWFLVLEITTVGVMIFWKAKGG